MKIIVNPMWSFMEALNAAWEAYSGGQELGTTNRIRVLEQWANVVGRSRAVTELEEALASYKDSKEIRKHLGLSDYTVKRLKRQFKKMPELPPFSNSREGNLEVLQLCKRWDEFIKEHESLQRNHTDIHFIMNQFIKLANKAGVDPISKLVISLSHNNTELTINENNLSQFLEISQKAGIDVIARLIEWITTMSQAEDIVNVLETLNVDNLQKLNAAVGLSNLKHVLKIWKNNIDNNCEEFWQCVLTQNPFLFAQLFSFPVIILENKAYVGGKSISNRGGNIIDFLCANHLTRNAVLIEIKTPLTKLLGSQYRGDIYNISNDLSGSTIQVTNYKNSLMQNYTTLVNSEEDGFEAFDPKCIVIIGNIETELINLKQRKSLELFRMGLKDVQIITYDELFGKVEFLVNLLEGNISE